MLRLGYPIALALTLTACASFDPAAQAQARRESYVSARPTLPPPIRAAILDGRPALGMTEADLEAALGTPRAVHTTMTAAGTQEQRVYERLVPAKVGSADYWFGAPPVTYYVYVREGRVVAIQESR